MTPTDEVSRSFAETYSSANSNANANAGNEAWRPHATGAGALHRNISQGQVGNDSLFLLSVVLVVGTYIFLSQCLLYDLTSEKCSRIRRGLLRHFERFSNLAFGPRLIVLVDGDDLSSRLGRHQFMKSQPPAGKSPVCGYFVRARVLDVARNDVHGQTSASQQKSSCFMHYVSLSWREKNARRSREP